jgi:predicted GNAT family acetyltransferase
VDVSVTDNPALRRYELRIDGAFEGEIVYRLEPGRIVLIHTEVSQQVEGQGLGAQLVKGALDDIRARGLRVVPLCPFVASYVRRHPEYGDLMTAA